MLRLCAAFVLAVLPLAACAGSGPSGPVRVIDADTWDVGGQRVRLFGIDAPEMDQPCKNPDGQIWACGRWATEWARQRFDHRRARCEQVDTDRYGRIVARCNVGGKDVGQVLVSEGIAFAYRTYSMDYDLDEKGAAINARGLHRTLVQPPADYRRMRSAAPPPPNHDCVIKGNISRNGQRIYHMPGQENYRQTRINTAKGEHWFCTESEARVAGWRRAKR